MAITGPFGCLDRHPTAQSIRFNGKYINLKEMSRLYNLDHGYLSRIFNKHRIPSIAYAKTIAKALHMQYEDFLASSGYIEADVTVGRMTLRGLVWADLDRAIQDADERLKKNAGS